MCATCMCYLLFILVIFFLYPQAAKFAIANLNSRFSAFKGRSVLLAGVECAPGSHELKIVGLGPCIKDPSNLHCQVVKQLKDTIFAMPFEGQEVLYSTTELFRQVNVRVLPIPSDCADQSSRLHVLIVCVWSDLERCADKLFMLRQSGASMYSKVYEMIAGSGRISEVLQEQMIELHNNISRSYKSTISSTAPAATNIS